MGLRCIQAEQSYEEPEIFRHKKRVAFDTAEPRRFPVLGILGRPPQHMQQFSDSIGCVRFRVEVKLSLVRGHPWESLSEINHVYVIGPAGLVCCCDEEA